MKPGARSDIKAAREALGLSQPKAAALLGLPVRTWRSWELGERNMPDAMWRLWRHCAGIEAIPFTLRQVPEIGQTPPA